MSEPKIPLPTEADKAIDLVEAYQLAEIMIRTAVDTVGYTTEEFQQIIRRCHAAEAPRGSNPIMKKYLWEPRYNLGASRAGGYDGPDGWWLWHPTDGWYCPGSRSPDCRGTPFYTSDDAMAYIKKNFVKVDVSNPPKVN